MRRYQLQLWEPDKGGWRTVLTAASAEALQNSARTLHWQTQKPVRLLGPEGLETLESLESLATSGRGAPAPKG